MMRETIRESKVILNEMGCRLFEWTTVLPSVQWALNTAVGQRFGASSSRVMLGREARTSFLTLVEKNELELMGLDVGKLLEHVQDTIDAQEQPHKGAVTRLEAYLEREREPWSRGGVRLSHFTLRDFVLVARVRKTGTSKAGGRLNPKDLSRTIGSIQYYSALCQGGALHPCDSGAILHPIFEYDEDNARKISALETPVGASRC